MIAEYETTIENMETIYNEVIQTLSIKLNHHLRFSVPETITGPLKTTTMNNRPSYIEFLELILALNIMDPKALSDLTWSFIEKNQKTYNSLPTEEQRERESIRLQTEFVTLLQERYDKYTEDMSDIFEETDSQAQYYDDYEVLSAFPLKEKTARKLISCTGASFESRSQSRSLMTRKHRGTPSPHSSIIPIDPPTDFNLIVENKFIQGYLKKYPYLFQFEIARFLQPDGPLYGKEFQVKWVSEPNPREAYNTLCKVINGYARKEKYHRAGDAVWDIEAGGPANNVAIHYGGTIKLFREKNFIITLNPPTVSSSSRFFRKYGADRFLELKLEKSLKEKLTSYSSKTAYLKQEYRRFLMKPLRVFDRTFSLFYAKSDLIYFFQTGKDVYSSIWEIINDHIPVDANLGMTVPKFLSRIALGFSGTRPSIEFSRSEIKLNAPDIFGTMNKRDDPANILTDGCAAISMSAMAEITKALRLPEMPSAVQGRIGGAKGVWFLDGNRNPNRVIEIRESQLKFKCDEYDHKNRILEICDNGIPDARNCATLNHQYLLVLTANGVPESVILDLANETVERFKRDLSMCCDPNLLRDFLCREGHVMHKRRKELKVNQEDSDTSSDDDNFEESTESVVDTERPMEKVQSIYERCLALVDAGFEPRSCPYLANQLDNVLRMSLSSLRNKCRVEVLQSCLVMCIADPTGVLEEGEVFLKFSEARLDERTRRRMDVVEGDIIVGRAPCILSSDMQKVRAVNRPELSNYMDIIVFSTKGNKSLASLLSGGDYDGDTIFCTWDPRIVNPFQQPVDRSQPPPRMKSKIDKGFYKEKKTIGELKRAAGRSTIDYVKAYQEEIVDMSIPTNFLGQYSVWHLASISCNGINDEDTIYLGHMCGMLVDAAKQGLTLNNNQWESDRRTYKKLPLPSWYKELQKVKNLKDYDDESNGSPIYESHRELIPDVLNKLGEFVNIQIDQLLKEDIVKSDAPVRDEDLANMWTSAYDAAKRSSDDQYKRDLDIIAKTISELYNDFSTNIARDLHFSSAKATPFARPSSSQGKSRVDQTNEIFAQRFQVMPDIESLSSPVLKNAPNAAVNLELLKSSYAYIYTWNRKKNNRGVQTGTGIFCWTVALRGLCRLKADAVSAKKKGMARTLVDDVYNTLQGDKSWLRRQRRTLGDLTF